MRSELQQYHISGKSTREIADHVEDLVRDGVLGPGQKLPTIRNLASALDISPTTVGAAYQRLRRRGVVQARGRNGTFIAPRPPVATPSLSTSERDGRIDLASGNPDPDLLIPLELLASRIPPTGPVLYGSPMTAPELAEVATARFEKEGFPVPGLVVTNGSLDAIERALVAHLRFGDGVAVEDPAYAATLDLIPALGYELRPVAMDDEGILPSSLSEAIAEGVSAILLTPRAQNPSGAALTPPREEELTEILTRHPDLLVIEDDHAAEISGSETTWVSRASRKWLVIRSLSKSISPDLRLAVSIGDEATIARITGRLALGPGWVSHHVQRMAAVAWSEPDVNERLMSARHIYRQRREALLESLERRGIHAHGASGFNVWVPVRDEVTVVQAMADMGWATTGGARFRQDSAPGVRVTTSTLQTEDAEDVAEALAHALEKGTSRPRPGTRAG